MNATAQYLGEPICASPILPSNTDIKFPSDLVSAVSAFQNRSLDNKTRAASQHLVERYLVEQGRCSKLNSGIVDDLRVRLFGIDSKQLDTKLASETSLNANLHDDIACSVDAIIYDGKMPGRLSPSQRERVRNWFPVLKQIGKESVEGYALRASFAAGTNLFVVKAPRNPKNDELVHEALVGFYALNKLRHLLPNYMYVYGYVTCSPPAINNREVITWCSSSNPAASYLITENIRDGVAIAEFLTDPSTTDVDVLIVFYQLLNALNLAFKYYGYTHYDFHYQNALVRKFGKLIAIPFFGANNKVIGYLVTRYVPFIIDYGYSRITVGDVGFGKIGLERAGVEGARPFPMYDVYKMLGFLGQQLYTQPRTPNYEGISALLEKLFSFFDEGTLLARVQRRLSSQYDFYGAPERYRDTTHQDYIDWLTNESRLQSPLRTNLQELAAQGIYPAPINDSIDTCDFYDMISSDQGPQSSLEYCEVVAALNADAILAPDVKESALGWLNNHFKADQYFLQTISGKEALVKEVDMLRQRNSLGSNGDIIPNLATISALTTVSFVNQYRARLLDLLRIKDITAEVISYVKASACSLINQKKYAAYRDRLAALNSQTEDWVQFVNRQRDILKGNVAVTRSIQSSDRTVQEFWGHEHENLVLAV
jgi:hypothetical protein